LIGTVFVLVTMIFSDMTTVDSGSDLQCAGTDQPERTRLCQDCQESRGGLGAFVRDQYRAFSTKDPNRRFGASGFDLGLSFCPLPTRLIRELRRQAPCQRAHRDCSEW
jgi:hypothetical protein